jgi:hypothetical protein
MNTPTPRTDAATYPADCLGTTLVTHRDCARALETELVTLTAAYTCTHHNDQQRAACPVCLVTALTAERDQLQAQLRALTLVCGTNDANKFETWVDRANARAERAEAELAAEREKAERYRLATLKLDAELAAERARFEHLEKIARLESGNCDRSTTSYYVIHIPTGRDHYKGGSDLPLAEAIDAAMKKGK